MFVSLVGGATSRLRREELAFLTDFRVGKEGTRF